MIVPVWISSTTTPEIENSVYALLDTQSSNTSVDQGECEKMGAGLEPVKLKFTTMMGKDSIVQSERVSGHKGLWIYLVTVLIPRHHSPSVGWIVLDVKSIQGTDLYSPVYP